jgi:hypothetical protein
MNSKYRKNFSVWLLLIFLTIINSSLSAQEPDSSLTGKKGSRNSVNVSDLQDLTSGGFNFWQDKFKGHFAGIDFGLNGLLNANYSGYPPSQSNFMNIDMIRSNSLFINFLSQSMGFQHNRNTFGLVSGLGFQFMSYRLSDNITIEKSTGGKIVPVVMVFDNNQKSKFSSVYLVAPLLTEIQFPIKHYANRFYFSAGVYGGLRIETHTKIKYRADKKKEKLKTPDDFSLNNFKYGLMVRMGYRGINVFATYDLCPLFKENLGPEFTPITFGITLLHF